MEQVGLITFTEATNARVQVSQVKSHGSDGRLRKPSGRINTYYDLQGEYRDHKNKLHDVNIRLFIVDDEYLDNYYLELNGNKYPIAYFNFNPDLHYLGIPSTKSCVICYSILVFLFLCGFFIYRHRAKTVLVWKNFEVGKVVRPNSFIVHEVNAKKGTCYCYYVIWETPDGLRCDSNNFKSSKEYFYGLDFDREYCAIYLKTRTGQKIIIHPEDIEKYKKILGFEIDGLDVKIKEDPKKTLRQNRHSR